MSTEFRILYATYYPKVYAICKMVLKNTDLAEEAAHDVFLQANEKLKTLKEPGKFGTWIGKIAFNYSKNLYNKNKKTVPMDNHEILDFYSEKNIVNNVPLTVMEEAELQDEMNEAIDRLTPTLQQLIIYKFYTKLPEAEIAKLMNMPIGTVKSSLQRAKKNLARILPAINKDFLKLVKGGVK